MRKLVIMPAVLAVLGGATVALAHYNEVSTNPTKADVAAVRSLLGPHARVDASATFEDQLRTIKLVQGRVLKAAPRNDGIPVRHTRELGDVLKAKYGLCYDRSRAIESALRVLGMRVRHIAVYSTAQHPAVESLLTPGTESHALTEVSTRRGWMLIDSNSSWISLRGDRRPLSIKQLQSVAPAARAEGDGTPPPPVFRHPFTWVYGLYSRHGDFYPPYTPVPDVNWSEFAANL
jgi:hypothetical protein